ncbi:MAG: GH39 family glycosyl hydrolase [Protaetiibacter sp.]
MKPIRTAASATIDFERAGGVPLSKERIAIYNSGLVPIDRYRRDADFLRRSRAESLRIDLGWGAEWMPWKHQPVVREADGSLHYRFEETDDVARVIIGAGLRPYWAYCYVPAASRPEGGDWRGMAEDDGTWVDLVRAYASGASKRGVAIGYHEVYNEPDLRDERTGQPHFYTGDLDDYLALYRATAAAIRSVDPTARIGGPALAVTAVNRRWLEAFLTMVVAEQLPLDFLSFHHYGWFSVENTLDIVDDVLRGFPGFEHLELHLNEYNSFQIDYPRGGLQDGHLLASSFASELPRLLARRSLTRTHWAQFLDSGEGNFSGMVDIDGVPKPVFSVYEFFQQMPVDRAFVEVDGPEGVGAIASADGKRAAVLAWNRHFTDISLSLAFGGARAERGVVRVIGPDGESSRFVGDESTVTVDVPTGGTVLLEFGEPAGEPLPRVVHRTHLPRTLGLDEGWCDVDEQTATFRFGVTADGVQLSCAADLTEATAPSAWTAIVTDALGRPARGRVTLTLEGANGTSTIDLTGDSSGAAAPVTARPAALRRDGDVRVTATLVDAAAGSLARVFPEGAA